MTKDVTYERILDARSEPENWLTYYGAYDGQRYSPLDQINKETVKQLAPAWVFQCGSVGLHSGKSTYSFEASPLVVDGMMYVSGWDGWVWCLDARTGAVRWQVAGAFGDPAVAGGRVFVGAGGQLQARSAATGALLWSRAGGTSLGSPTVTGGVVYALGTENGAPRLFARRADNGALRW